MVFFIRLSSCFKGVLSVFWPFSSTFTLIHFVSPYQVRWLNIFRWTTQLNMLSITWHGGRGFKEQGALMPQHLVSGRCLCVSDIRQIWLCWCLDSCLVVFAKSEIHRQTFVYSCFVFVFDVKTQCPDATRWKCVQVVFPPGQFGDFHRVSIGYRCHTMLVSGNDWGHTDVNVGPWLWKQILSRGWSHGIGCTAEVSNSGSPHAPSFDVCCLSSWADGCWVMFDRTRHSQMYGGTWENTENTSFKILREFDVDLALCIWGAFVLARHATASLGLSSDSQFRYRIIVYHLFSSIRHGASNDPCRPSDGPECGCKLSHWPRGSHATPRLRDDQRHDHGWNVRCLGSIGLHLCAGGRWWPVRSRHADATRFEPFFGRRGRLAVRPCGGR